MCVFEHRESHAWQHKVPNAHFGRRRRQAAALAGAPAKGAAAKPHIKPAALPHAERRELRRQATESRNQLSDSMNSRNVSRSGLSFERRYTKLGRIMSVMPGSGT